jgi:hypothetical protein
VRSWRPGQERANAIQAGKTHPRLWSLDAGVAMVVTDLHGDWDAYARYRDQFIGL